MNIQKAKTKLFTQLLTFLQTQLNKQADAAASGLPYNSLSPIGDAPIENDYRKALDWALANRKRADIKNIALTGPYGSGKSSILKSYAANARPADIHILNISLATFKEEEMVADQATKEQMLRLIELSILQQIFYHEKDEQIPDSRFRKIKRFSRPNLLLTAVAIFFLLFAVLLLVFPTLLTFLFTIQPSEKAANLLHLLAVALTTIGVFTLIYKSIRILNGLKISKLNIQNAEIELDNEISKSVLNHHVDEILYFFEVTPYNVVVIEDLDRFRQTEIFTKLREINLLINNSKKINKHVVFIYAVRDDMFNEQNERTKFFDFIIPVIPVINPSNSSQKLLEKKDLYNFHISEDLVDTIALFIDDMRLLHNIINEFYMYQVKLNKNLNQDRLLSLIVYKNIFPKDFTLLSKNEGVLYNALNSKTQYINTELQWLDQEIARLKQEISEIDAQRIPNMKELRLAYLPFFIQKLSGFVSFHYSGKDLDVKEVVTDTNFNLLATGKLEYKYVRYYNDQYIQSSTTKIEHIENLVDPVHSYEEKRKKVEGLINNRIDSLRKDIERLETEKTRVRNYPVAELLNKKQYSLPIENKTQNKLVSVLLREGYINEDYLDYISIFYDVSITKDDYSFLLNVKSQVATPFSHPLHNIGKLLPKINLQEFEREFVLNYDLLTYLLANSSHAGIKQKLLTKLSDESEASVHFITGFIEAQRDASLLFGNLLPYWSNIWTYIETKSSFTAEKKETYFRLILQNANAGVLKQLYSSAYFKNYLLGRPDILTMHPDTAKMKSIIKTLDIKFEQLVVDRTTPPELLTFLYEGNYYAINPDMVKLMLKQADAYDEAAFQNRPYQAIGEAGCQYLIAYISQNINEFVKQVYLNGHEEKEDAEEYILDLLNHDDLIIENKEKIIKIMKISVSDINHISKQEVKQKLLEAAKMVPSWENVFHFYKADGKTLSAVLVSFLAYKEALTRLSCTKIPEETVGEVTYLDFAKELIACTQLNDESYALLLPAVPFSFSSLDFQHLNRNRTALLIRQNILQFSSESFKSLKKHYPGLQIQFAEQHKARFLSSLATFELDSLDVFYLLQSTVFTNSEKNKVVDNTEEDLVTTIAGSVKMIGQLILQDSSFRVSDSLLLAILANKELTVEQRIRIHNWKYTQLELDYATFLNSLGEPHADIAIRGKRPLVPDSEYNRKLLDILVSKNFISSVSVEQKGLRVITFRTSNEE